MTRQNPTDRQLAMWWMHEAIARRHDLRPTWASVQFAVNAAFKIEVREKRAKRLRNLIRNEIDNLLAIYEKKARALL